MTVGSKRSVSVTTDPCDNSDHFIFNTDVMRYHDNLLRSSEPVQGVGEETLAPLMTSCAFTKCSQTSQEKKTAHQFGLLARAIEGSPSVVIEDPRVFYNITPPSSTFICGSQGSGKSHTLSCILESCLIPSKAGQLPNPLTGIVFHYDTFISDTMGSPCEAAFLSSHPDIEVRVLCAPTNLHAIKGAYSRLNIAVSALEIDQRNLNTKRMLDLMAVGQDDGPMPLYMHTVKRILREMRMEQQAAHTGFGYRTFKNKVLGSNLTPAQLEPLKQRLEMLESFMPQLQTLPISRKNKAASEGIDWKPKARRLTVVDLSCPCISPETACSLFNICLGIFLEQDPEIGRVVALDEAHKYMNSSLEARGFTETLLSAVRLQRHLGVRMIISTQEPTVSTTLLNLCSTTIVHRFTSPEWLHILHKHLAGASRSLFGGSKTDNHDTEAVSQLSLFEEIVNLQVGEAILFSPSMVVKASSCDSNGKATLCRLGHGNLRVRIRQRLTLDGGKSVLSR